jgi:hypothetical protein
MLLSVMAACSLAFSCSGALAGVVTGYVQCQFSCTIKDFGISGEIDGKVVSDVKQLVAQAKQRSAKGGKETHVAYTKVKLNSPGGSVGDAIELGRIFRKERLVADVSGGQCNSACVIVYAGAVVREGRYTGGKIGIHRPYHEVPKDEINPDGFRREYTAMLDELRAYFHEMNVPERLADEMLKTPPSEMRYLSSSEQDRFGLLIFDPVDEELSTLESAKEMGVDRPEYYRRQNLSLQYCYPHPEDVFCYDTVMKTGKAPPAPAPSNADLSQFGVPAE